MHRVKEYFILSICIPLITSGVEHHIHIWVNHSDVPYYTLLINVIGPFFPIGIPIFFLLIGKSFSEYWACGLWHCKYFHPMFYSIVKFFYCAICWAEILNFDLIKWIIFTLCLNFWSLAWESTCIPRSQMQSLTLFLFMFLSHPECFFVYGGGRLRISFIILHMGRMPEFPKAFSKED